MPVQPNPGGTLGQNGIRWGVIVHFVQDAKGVFRVVVGTEPIGKQHVAIVSRRLDGSSLDCTKPTVLVGRTGVIPASVPIRAEDQCDAYAHPKGVYAYSEQWSAEYEKWRDVATKALRAREAVLDHPVYGALWRRDILQSYVDKAYQGSCIMCGGVRRGSLANPDHSHCESCRRTDMGASRYCRCCGRVFTGRGTTSLAPECRWLLSLRRDI